jgi:UDP-N-acetylglucosamine diphosphorylase / glucose-1-phosphate thymidylyltransferase / UDP-N-acetylgalactosamine diphosphorylase / glucosamine-1-phosphate N-acetyltransferase / galactosamine-1-phosphate N-acetyltransferase
MPKQTQETIVVLFDDPEIKKSLLPLTYTKAIGDLRVGLYTNEERWKTLCGYMPSFSIESYLRPKYPNSLKRGMATNILAINSAILPTKGFFADCRALGPNQGYVRDGRLLAFWKYEGFFMYDEVWNGDLKIEVSEFQGLVPLTIENLSDFCVINGERIIDDFAMMFPNGMGRSRTAPIDNPWTAVYNEDDIYISENVDLKAASLNAENGPIFIGEGARIMEGAMIQGPACIGERAVVGMGAKIRPNTTIGYGAKVAGEVSNSIIGMFSNKGHEGFMGNSIIGDWCNWGAGTNNSNLKNDYSEVALWNYASNSFEGTGLKFVGLVMGDHSKCGINTMFNTGSVVGVNCNIYGGGYQPRHIPSFSWGGGEDFKPYRLDKAIQVAEEVMTRRGQFHSFENGEDMVLKSIHEMIQKGIFKA